MHYIFIDFESEVIRNNFFSKMTEFYAIDENNNIILNEKFNDKYTEDNKENINKCFYKLVDYCNLKFKNEEVYFVFWHNWMIQYLSKKSFNILQNILRNKYLILCNICLVEKLKENKPFIYLSSVKIDNITSLLLGRNHKGNALDDCKDLRECFKKIIR